METRRIGDDEINDCFNVVSYLARKVLRVTRFQDKPDSTALFEDLRSTGMLTVVELANKPGAISAESFKKYAAEAAYRMMLRGITRRHHPYDFQPVFESLTEIAHSPSALPTPEEDARSAERKEALERATEKLTSRQRRIVRLMYVEERPATEVAELLGASVQTIRNLHHAALDTLRRELSIFAPGGSRSRKQSARKSRPTQEYDPSMPCPRCGDRSHKNRNGFSPRNGAQRIYCKACNYNFTPRAVKKEKVDA